MTGLRLVEPDDSRATMEELLAAWKAPGRLIDQPVVQRLLTERARRHAAIERPSPLRVIRGGEDAA